VHLSVGQEARLDVTLYVAAADVDPEIVTDTAVVNTLTRTFRAGLGKNRLKIYHNGRSYDLLMPLNPGL